MDVKEGELNSTKCKKRCFVNLLKRTVGSEIIRYLIIGVLTTAVDFIIVTILRETFGDAHKFLFNSIAVVAAIVFAFFANRIFVFRSQGDPWQEFLTFFSSRILISFIFSNGTIWILEDLLDFKAKVPYIRLTWSKLIGAILVVIFNYIVGKFFVFKKPSNSQRKKLL